jgi:acyl-CoA synthetase (AMP-forming)/AMP-acid ligase II
MSGSPLFFCFGIIILFLLCLFCQCTFRVLFALDPLASATLCFLSLCACVCCCGEQVQTLVGGTAPQVYTSSLRVL